MASHAGVSLFYHPEDGREWAGYLCEKLDSKDCPLSIEMSCIPEGRRCRLSSRVNVVLFTPSCLELTKWTWVRQFNSIAVLAGITYEDLVTVMVRGKSVHVLDWLSFELAATDDSVRTLLVIILSMYERAEWAERGSRLFPEFPDDDEFQELVPSKGHEADKGECKYDTLPKHRRQVNKIFDAVSPSPHMKEDIIYVILDRKHDCGVTPRVSLETGDIVPLTHLKEKAVYTFPRPVDPAIKEFNVMLEDEDIGLSQIPPPHGGPKGHTASQGSTKSRSSTHMSLDNVRDLLSHLLDPVTVLRQCLGLETDSEFDDLMANMLQLPDFQRPDTASSFFKVPHKSESHWPTPLHFGAEMNLKHFCSTLLSNSLVQNACHIENCDGLTPLGLARDAGSEDVVELLQAFEETPLETQQDSTPKDQHDSGYHGGPSQGSQDWTPGENDEDQPKRPESLEEEDPFPSIMSISGAAAERPKSITKGFSDSQLEGLDKSRSEEKEDDTGPGLSLDMAQAISEGQPADDSSPTETPRKRGFFDMFKRRQRSNSEPCLTITETQQRILRNKGKAFSRKMSVESGGFFAKTGSTYSSCSDSSDGKAEELKKQANLKSKETKEKSGKKIGFFMKNAKKRKSLRLKRTMQVTGLSPPTLPGRKESDADRKD